LFVRPRYFERNYPFLEYLLRELVRTLLSGGRDDEEEAHQDLLPALACALTHRMLEEAVLSLNPQRNRSRVGIA